MREGRPSSTAAAVAFARGIAGIDPVAAALLPRPLAFALRAPWTAPAWNAASLGLVDHIELRTKAIDAAVRAHPAPQLVILGAGLDARAHRLRELQGTVVFEVDHPSTQEYKRRRIASRVPFAREVRYVAVDFEHDSLVEKLVAAGHRVDVPSFWIWEGVTMYLHPAAVTGTLEQVASRSALGSHLAATYGIPKATSLGNAFGRAMHVAFRALGEPIIGLMTQSQMATELALVGFRPIADTDPHDWAEGERRMLHVLERLVVAEK